MTHLCEKIADLGLGDVPLGLEHKLAIKRIRLVAAGQQRETEIRKVDPRFKAWQSRWQQTPLRFRNPLTH